MEGYVPNRNRNSTQRTVFCSWKSCKMLSQWTDRHKNIQLNNIQDAPICVTIFTRVATISYRFILAVSNLVVVPPRVRWKVGCPLTEYQCVELLGIWKLPAMEHILHDEQVALPLYSWVRTNLHYREWEFSVRFGSFSLVYSMRAMSLHDITWQTVCLLEEVCDAYHT